MERIAENVLERMMEAVEDCDRALDGGDAHDLMEAVDLARGSMQAAYDLIKSIPTDTWSYVKWLEEELDKRVPRWISVEERLADVKTKLSYEYSDELLVLEDERVLTVYYCHTIGVWYNALYEDEELSVTHWMPLPEPPKEDDHGKEEL